MAVVEESKIKDTVRRLRKTRNVYSTLFAVASSNLSHLISECATFSNGGAIYPFWITFDVEKGIITVKKAKTD